MINLTSIEATNILTWHLHTIPSSAPLVRESLKMGIEALSRIDEEEKKLKKDIILDSINIGTKIFYLNENQETVEDKIESVALSPEGLIIIYSENNKKFTEEDLGENVFLIREILDIKNKNKENFNQLSQDGLVNNKTIKSLEQIEIEYLDGFDSDGDGYSDGHELRNGTNRKENELIRER